MFNSVNFFASFELSGDLSRNGLPNIVVCTIKYFSYKIASRKTCGSMTQESFATRHRSSWHLQLGEVFCQFWTQKPIKKALDKFCRTADENIKFIIWKGSQNCRLWFERVLNWVAEYCWRRIPVPLNMFSKMLFRVANIRDICWESKVFSRFIKTPEQRNLQRN